MKSAVIISHITNILQETTKGWINPDIADNIVKQCVEILKILVIDNK